MKKEAISKTQRGLRKRHPMKKEATLKTQWGLTKRHPMKKEAPQKCKGVNKKTTTITTTKPFSPKQVGVG
jgi:hypothetical protein